MSKTEKKLQKKIAGLKAKLKVQKQREKAASKARDAADTAVEAADMATEKAQRVYDRADGRYVTESDKTENLGREIEDAEAELTREQEAPPSPISDD